MSLIDSRRSHSENRLSDFRKKITNSPDISEIDDLCIYVTGSYARGEASEFSDLDLFFVGLGSAEKNQLSKIDKTLMDAELIHLCRDLNFPEFSNQGQYLEIHYLEDMIANLGSPTDDFENSFTARMLLLLESAPIHNERIYEDSIRKIISTYYRDYHDHEKNFLPIFLVNDIIRFWKTRFLDYEHIRNRKNKTELEKIKHI